ncbi:MAG: phosphate acetyltransferase [Woeseia sp.]|nr:phosphate acetyltransferase [Woeseia sp.]
MLSEAQPECPLHLLAKARNYPPVSTAVVNAGTSLAMDSARLAADEGLIKPILVGRIKTIERLAREINWNLEDVRLVSCSTESEASSIAVSLARNGEAGALMKGHVHTDDLMRAVLKKDEGLYSGTRLSHVFHMTVPNSDKVLCITDAVINILPSVHEKIDIARNAVGLMHSLGNLNPAIALLSGTEVANSKMPSSIDAEEINRLAASGEIEGGRISGPLSFDIAVSKEAAKIKGVACDVAGQADVLVVPNIEAGNFLFKQMVYFMSATAAGIVLGATVPIMLTSRADPPAARLASAALASIYSAQ